MFFLHCLPIQHSTVPGPKFSKIPFIQSTADSCHQLVVKMEIVEYGKPEGKHFVGGEQMPKVCSGEMAAQGTAAVGIHGAVVQLVLLILHI